MIQLNRLVESAVLSALDLDTRKITPKGVRYLLDNGCPMVVLFYDGKTLPKSDKYHRMSTIDGNKAIAVMVDMLGATWEDDKYYMNYED